MKILFVHGLASSGAYKLADMLRITLKAEVVAPDVPIDPDEALGMLRVSWCTGCTGSPGRSSTRTCRWQGSCAR